MYPVHSHKVCYKEGIVSLSQVQVHGRKFSLLSLRNKLLKAHEKYMFLATDSDFANLTETELLTFVGLISLLKLMHKPISYVTL